MERISQVRDGIGSEIVDRGYARTKVLRLGEPAVKVEIIVVACPQLQRHQEGILTRIEFVIPKFGRSHRNSVTETSDLCSKRVMAVGASSIRNALASAVLGRGSVLFTTSSRVARFRPDRYDDSRIGATGLLCVIELVGSHESVSVSSNARQI